MYSNQVLNNCNNVFQDLIDSMKDGKFVFNNEKKHSFI